MKYILTLLCINLTLFANSQDTTQKVFGFPITDYIIRSSDTIQIVQVNLPDGISIKEKTVGLLKSVSENGKKEMIDIGAGRCYLIKGDSYYFGIKLSSDFMPKEGDIVYTMIAAPNMHGGILYDVAKHGIRFTKIDETNLLTLLDVLLIKNEEDENYKLDQFVTEVNFTGKTMLDQNDNQDMIIPSGKYKGKALYNTLLEIKKSDVIDFLEYMSVKPGIYFGKTWKFSEVFATWLSEGAPMVIKN